MRLWITSDPSVPKETQAAAFAALPGQGARWLERLREYDIDGMLRRPLYEPVRLRAELSAYRRRPSGGDAEV